ncbi:cysteine desulfurase family protein [bacterium endosymbiont of Pedicinus badii]|uniref:cysteine desulfurase family protein n=1 Tax=bacterium endosymbiont of Pedicinus badii TaxID=1719126 RepID=UPI0009B96DD9|nr:aminotransferase class V-fold PLP-dependent enzyme [bacterium endosymbiont of Pedicinus badii]OQM34488.1 hypothetical protein AOQ89_01205 [bacterium endosymbiont of Pedicinus badii]
MKFPIYLDYCSTTPVDHKVVEEMNRYFTIEGIFGNPGASHYYGIQAKNEIKKAKDKIASILKIRSEEIIFTSGATESNNLAIKGIVNSKKKFGNHILTSSIEHKSILESCNFLKQNGFLVTTINPNKKGIIAIQNIKNSINEKTILISIMHVNNETGTIQNIKKIGEICRKKNIIFHVDAAQSFGKVPINLSKIPVDLLSLSGHKIYGPKGIGILFIRNKIKKKISSQIHGGNQQYGIRSGTLPVHLIIGMSKAMEISNNILSKEKKRISFLKLFFLKEIKKITRISINGSVKDTIPNIINISFHKMNVEYLLSSVQELAISQHSSCFSKNSSYVLQSMGVRKKLIDNSIRISFGKFTSKKDVVFLLKKIQTICNCIK